MAISALTPTAQIPQQPAQFDPMAFIQAFLQQNQQHDQTMLQMQDQHLKALPGLLMAPESRHLGMSGEDVTNQKGPYDSGGIDWLKSHNDGTNGRVNMSPQNAAMYQPGPAQNMWMAANNPAQTNSAAGITPVTQALTAPTPQVNYNAPVGAFAAQKAARDQSFANMFSAINKGRTQPAM